MLFVAASFNRFICTPGGLSLKIRDGSEGLRKLCFYNPLKPLQQARGRVRIYYMPFTTDMQRHSLYLEI